MQIEREQEAERVEKERAKIKREQDEKRVEKKTPSKKRNHDDMDIDEEEAERKEKREALPDVGAHGVARQDGVGVHQGMSEGCHCRFYYLRWRAGAMRIAVLTAVRVNRNITIDSERLFGAAQLTGA